MKKKRLLLPVLFCCIVFTGFWSIAGSVTKAEEKYDEDLYGPEDPIVWTSPVEGVVFEHKVHVVDSGLDCDSCHDDIFEMMTGTAEEEDDFTMKSMSEGLYCGNCHYEGGFAFTTESRCTSCHIGVRGIKRLEGSADQLETSH